MSATLKIFIIAILAAGVLILLISALKTKHFFKCIFWTAVQGIAAIAAINVIGMITGTRLAVNWYTLSCGAICGTPGVIAMMILQVMFNT